MATSQVGKLLRLPQANQLSPDPGGDAQARFNAAVRSVTALQEEIRSTQNMLHQVAVGLERQLAALDACREELSALAPVLAGPTTPGGALLTPENAQLAIYCFGRFEVYLRGQPVSLRGSGKGATILKYLAATRGATIQRDALLEVLWPETEPATANNRLKVAIHHLRQAFEQDECQPDCHACILYESGCYFFNPDIRIWTDVQAFEQNCAAGLRLEQAGRLAEALLCYSEAANLYRGDFLEEDSFEEWTLISREDLRDRYLILLDRLSRHWLSSGDVDRAIDGWTKVLAKDPWREDAYRALMVALWGRGSRGPALRWYERCVQVLKEQLGIDPEPETVLLYERIRSGEIPKASI